MCGAGPPVSGSRRAHLSARADAGHQLQWLLFSPRLPEVMLSPSRVPEQQAPLGDRKGQRCPEEPRTHLADNSLWDGEPTAADAGRPGALKPMS